MEAWACKLLLYAIGNRCCSSILPNKSVYCTVLNRSSSFGETSAKTSLNDKVWLWLSVSPPKSKIKLWISCKAVLSYLKERPAPAESFSLLLWPIFPALGRQNIVPLQVFWLNFLLKFCLISIIPRYCRKLFKISRRIKMYSQKIIYFFFL